MSINPFDPEQAHDAWPLLAALRQQAAVVDLDVAADAFAVWDVTTGRFVVEPGRYELHAGPSSADLPLTTALTLVGPAVHLVDRNRYRTGTRLG